MSMQEDLENQHPDDEKLVRVKRSEVDRLSEEAARAKGLDKELAMLRAGVDPESPAGALVIKAYDGELDPAKIREFAGTIPGALREHQTPPPPPVEDGAQELPGEAQFQHERQNLGGEGALIPEFQAPKKAARDEAMEIARDLMDRGAPMEDAIGAGFARLITAAKANDPSVLFDPGSVNA